VLVGVEIVRHDVEAEMDRIARSEPGEDREKVIDAFVFAHLAYQAIGMNIP
jgi:hypothetical protein